MDGSSAHQQTLRDRHEALDRQIAEENKRPVPDEIVLHDLKRQKLQIKDELSLS